MNGYLNCLICMLWALGVILSVDAQEFEVYRMHPDWSPHGTRICFASNRSGNDEIFIKNLGNEKTKQVTCNSVLDSYPSWSQDGSKIYYHSGSDGNWGIHVFDLETGDSNQLVPVSALNRFNRRMVSFWFIRLRLNPTLTCFCYNRIKHSTLPTIPIWTVSLHGFQSVRS